jgi:sialate O-acetylesterase
MFHRFYSTSLMILMISVSAELRAEIKPASVFNDHMVLQRDMKVPVWGKASPGEEIIIEFAGQRQSAKAEKDGKWRIELEPMPANATPQTLSISSGNSKSAIQNLKFEDVLVGEVWLCSGQSNMDFPVSNNGSSVTNAKEEIANANYPQIRLLKIPRGNSKEPLDSFKANWEECSPQTVGPISGVAYFFGRELFQKLNVPVGLINPSYGGTPVEAWMSAETMKSNPACAPTAARLEKTIAEWPVIMEKYKADSDTWTKEEAEAKAAGEKFSKPKPRQPVGANHPYAPVGVYNSMLHPLIPYGLRGVIWYQGEGNSRRAEEYHGLFTALIEQWRKEWNQGDFPFYYVQLANFKGTDDHPDDWAWLREAQTQTLSTPNTGMAISIDLGDPNELHPRNKQDVGKRLALIALNKTYGQSSLEFTGPVYTGSKSEGTALRLSFDHATGLTSQKTPLTGFEVAGEDKKFVPASAVIEDETILVSSPQVTSPAAVRYAWTNAPEACLYNAAGLPAIPFRTDSWER